MIDFSRIILNLKNINVPEKIMTNDDLARIVDTNDEWITVRTGIKERRIADEN